MAVYATARDPASSPGLKDLAAEHPSLVEVLQVDVKDRSSVQVGSLHGQVCSLVCHSWACKQLKSRMLPGLCN